jgi:hypothetical protein
MTAPNPYAGRRPDASMWIDAGGLLAACAARTDAPLNGAADRRREGRRRARLVRARPSGTEDMYKLYAESLRGEEHLERILVEAKRSSTPRWRQEKAHEH